MGGIADAMAAYAQPLLDKTDGSHQQVQNAMTFAMLCYNLSLRPDSEVDAALDELRPSLHMNDADFAEFRRTIVNPMRQRHREMFPRLHQPRSGDVRMFPSEATAPASVPPLREKYPGTGRNAGCPCGSGRKYKRCCGG